MVIVAKNQIKILIIYGSNAARPIKFLIGLSDFESQVNRYAAKAKDSIPPSSRTIIELEILYTGFLLNAKAPKAFIQWVDGSILDIFCIFCESISVGIITPPITIEGINITWANNTVTLLLVEHTPIKVPSPAKANNETK